MSPPLPVTLKPGAPKRSAPRQTTTTTGNTTLSPPGTLRKKLSAGILTTSTTATGKTTARITTTATVYPPAAPASATATGNTRLGSRHPLRVRNENATPAVRTVKPGTGTPRPLPLTTGRMPPHERPSVAGHRQPTVGRTVNKPPLTPKIATRPAAPQHQAPTLATPLARRSTAELTLGVNANNSRDRDDLTSPVSAFLGNNVTPRSGARQNRVDSVNSTPNGTPNPDRQDPMETRAEDAHKRPVVTFSPASEAGSIRPDRDSKFFYASDAPKTAVQTTAAKPSAPQQQEIYNLLLRKREYLARAAAWPSQALLSDISQCPRQFDEQVHLCQRNSWATTPSEDWAVSKKVVRSTSPLLSPHPEPPLPSNSTTTGFASLLQAAEDFAEEETDEEDQPQSAESPTKTPQDNQPTELVANARRERKVQDLQITNASLEAINRTLERQLRKQTAELRSYQRLSRSGRLSMASMGSRIPSDSTTAEGSGLARAGIDLDNLSEEQSEKEAEDAELGELHKEEEEEDDLSGSEASGEMSPGAKELRHEKQRRGERRLEADLSKHQQLLVDSQKINQSLKRCLGWTEELIKEGKRALEYRVRPSDVELGGRVLAPEELERRERSDEEDEDQMLDEHTIYAIDALGRGSLDNASSISTWSKDPQDRDSGIELPTDSGE
ncbi:hypothetical protein CHGG_10863 [Chaetomium globosum CBS 148.51]|uniref:Uncharacterized protein n=1 Tax=Chaetomium globosum (strain ATCC 6205 / CBS 148.51 / DSM 1962 / NBRC 6347 / NRRL 1970) TaxID=306901 RepID=Q2GME1_CHAGB|nr:uncharacterized protein CHGG_10863 [Chaetomium globosum CBS 148.51]EAQ83045.1 hypothetical protein CHGG_10863 [Chaetomium globosum CBS 148.51]